MTTNNDTELESRQAACVAAAALPDLLSNTDDYRHTPAKTIYILVDAIETFRRSSEAANAELGKLRALHDDAETERRVAMVDRDEWRSAARTLARSLAITASAAADIAAIR